MATMGRAAGALGMSRRGSLKTRLPVRPIEAGQDFGASLRVFHGGTSPGLMDRMAW